MLCFKKVIFFQYQIKSYNNLRYDIIMTVFYKHIDKKIHLSCRFDKFWQYVKKYMYFLNVHKFHKNIIKLRESSKF